MNFYIIGLPKTATTSIYEILSSDERISLGGEKEHNFFSEDIHSFKTVTSKTISEYVAKFDLERVCVDISVNYSVSEVAANHIKEFNPNARILLILRDPESYLRSQFKQLVYAGYEKRFSLKLATISEIHGVKNRYQEYIKLIDYVQLLRRWRMQFPNMTIVKFEDLIAEDDTLHKTVYSWLDLPLPTKTINFHVNRSEGRAISRFAFYQRSFSKLGISKFLPLQLKVWVKRLIERRAVEVDSSTSDLPDQYKCKLAESIRVYEEI